MVNGGSDGAFEAGEREGSGMDVECLELERGIGNDQISFLTLQNRGQILLSGIIQIGINIPWQSPFHSTNHLELISTPERG